MDLASLPLVEGVGIVGQEERQLFLSPLDLHLYRRAAHINGSNYHNSDQSMFQLSSGSSSQKNDIN